MISFLASGHVLVLYLGLDGCFDRLVPVCSFLEENDYKKASINGIKEITLLV